MLEKLTQQKYLLHLHISLVSFSSNNITKTKLYFYFHLRTSKKLHCFRITCKIIQLELKYIVGKCTVCKKLTDKSFYVIIIICRNVLKIVQHFCFFSNFEQVKYSQLIILWMWLNTCYQKYSDHKCNVYEIWVNIVILTFQKYIKEADKKPLNSFPTWPN